MNEQVRRQIKLRMKERGLTQARLGELIGMAQPNVQRLLSGGVAGMTEGWQKVLDVLELEVVVQDKQED